MTSSYKGDIFFIKRVWTAIFLWWRTCIANLKVLFKYYLVVSCSTFVSFFLKGIAFLPSFVAWLEDFSVDDDGKTFSSLGKKLRTLVTGLYSFLLLVVV